MRTLPMAVTHFCSGGVEIRYVLLVLWMASCLRIMAVNIICMYVCMCVCVCTCCSVASGGSDPVFHRRTSRPAGTRVLPDAAVLPPRTRKHHQNSQRHSPLLM